MRKTFEIGGLIAAVVLIAFGVGALVMSVHGRNTVRNSLKLEQIVGTPDMTPSAIKAEAQKAGLDLSKITLPTKSVAGLPINSGDRARTFAGYMRIHTLEATGGLTYAQMPRYATADGKGTNDPAAALKDPKTGQPVDNGARNIWVTETALTTALNTSYLAEQISLFGVVVGIALLLSGIGFGVLAAAGALRGREAMVHLPVHTSEGKAVPAV
jgi:F0F1-type ATP synthase membrane subunit c/vacuolar-type H+-ATPase subunit K